VKNGESPRSQVELVTIMLLTVMMAGFLGGTLCNLSGLFTQILDNDGGFPGGLEIPFYIRPWTGLMTGLLSFFVGNLLATSLAVNPAMDSWQNLTGRWPFIAIAILAGFAAQDFIERLKETAQTLFSERTDAARYGKWEKAAPILEKLADLRSKNVLTEAEFLEDKTHILNRLKPPNSPGNP
jgi:hypothetical protein